MAKNKILGPIFTCLAQIWAPKFFLRVLFLLDVRYCHKLSLLAISRKTYHPNSIKWEKISFWSWFRPIGPKFRLSIFFFFFNLVMDTRYHGQLLSSTTSEKTSDLLLRKLSAGWMDRQTDRQTEWFHRKLPD